MQISIVLQQQWKKAGIIYFQADKESTLEYMRWDATFLPTHWHTERYHM